MTSRKGTVYRKNLMGLSTGCALTRTLDNVSFPFPTRKSGQALISWPVPYMVKVGNKYPVSVTVTVTVTMTVRAVHWSSITTTHRMHRTHRTCVLTTVTSTPGQCPFPISDPEVRVLCILCVLCVVVKPLFLDQFCTGRIILPVIPAGSCGHQWLRKNPRFVSQTLSQSQCFGIMADLKKN